MAVRLSVLVLRPPGGGSSWHAHSDDLLGHLLGRPGLDLTLLERLPDAVEGSTETLALESIGGHVACLAWQDPEEVMANLDRAGRPMSRRPHAGDPGGADEPTTESESPMSPESTRRGRMYFFDMRYHGDAQEVFAALQKLLQTLQVPTFQINSQPKPAAARTQSASTTIPDRSSAPSRSSVPARSTRRVSSEPLESRTDVRTPASQSDALDRLCDELDAFDG